MCPVRLHRVVNGIAEVRSAVVYRSGGCSRCGGEPFHHLGCPFVKWSLIFSTIVLGLVLAVFILVRGLDDGVPGPVILFVLYVALTAIWLVASRGSEPFDP
jgi:hypothetical protein